MLQHRDTPETDLEFAVCDILEDERKIIPELLPQTGISVEMEELLSSTFIQSPVYGTRCSNFLRLKNDVWLWQEKSQQGETQGNIIQIDLPLSK